MIRLILFLLIIILLSLGVSWLAEEPGQVAIEWSVYHAEMSVLTLVAAVAAFALVCVIIYWAVFAMLRSPRMWMQARNVKRQSLGLTALTETFAAIASQDVRSARRYLKRAEALLPEQPLTLMLASQVARLEGNDSKSQLYLEKMSKAGVTEFMALRGMVENARRAGEYDVALRHAEKAYQMKPNDHWLATTLIGLYATTGKLEEALQVLHKAARKRALQSSEVHPIRAAVLTAHAKALADKQQWVAAAQSLKIALRGSPKFVPAIVQLAHVYVRQGDISMALKTAGDGWRRLAHPEIGGALLGCYDAAKDKKKAAKILRKLAKAQSDNDEAQVLMAGLAAREGDNASALGILKHLIVSSGETARICSLIAAVEHAQENHDQEAYWHRHAKDAPSAMLWECGSCKRTTDKWELTCPQCGAVGSIA